MVFSLVLSSNVSINSGFILLFGLMTILYSIESAFNIMIIPALSRGLYESILFLIIFINRQKRFNYNIIEIFFVFFLLFNETNTVTCLKSDGCFTSMSFKHHSRKAFQKVTVNDRVNHKLFLTY